MKNSRAFSLPELLIATAILMSILALLARGLMGSSTAVNSIITEAQLLEDTRSAGQIISDSLSRAAYIYPPNKRIVLNTKSSWTVQNPNGTNNQWITGKDPILAFINAAEKQGKCSKANNKACLYFVAYYPIKRSIVTAKAAYGSALTDKNNQDSWVLFEYRKRLDINQLTEIQQPPLEISGSSGKLLADFIAPKSGFRLRKIFCKNPDGTRACKNNSEPDYRETISSGEFVLLAKYKRKAGSSKTPEMVFSIFARNLD